MVDSRFLEGKFFPLVMTTLLVVCTILLVALTYRATVAPPLRPLPFRYLDPRPALDNAQVCPGDVLTFEVGMRIIGAPASVIIHRSVWDVKEQFTRQRDIAPEVLNLVNNGEVHERDFWRVPPLPPGKYELRTVSQTYASVSAKYTLSFTVKEGCP